MEIRQFYRLDDPLVNFHRDLLGQQRFVARQHPARKAKLPGHG